MTNIMPPPAAWTMAIGFTPTQLVLVAAKDEVLMVLMEPVFGQIEFGPELRTYITPAWVVLSATGCEPTGRLIVVTTPVWVTLNELTVSLPPLLTNTAPAEVLRKAS